MRQEPGDTSESEMRGGGTDPVRPKDAPLPRSQSIAYAMGGLAMNLTNLVVSQWLYALYVPDRQNPLVPAALFGAIFMLGRVTDAVTDPLIAYWSDRSTSPGGRRLPFIRLGLLPFAIVFFLLWTPPVAGAHWINAVYALVMIQLYFVLYTVVVAPYLALLPEIATGVGQRINLSTLQALFVMVGTVVFGIMGIVVQSAGWTAIGWIVGGLVLVSFLPTAFLVRERVAPGRVGSGTRESEAGELDSGGAVAGQGAGTDAAPRGLLNWAATTLRNRPFRHLLAATSLYWVTLNLLLLLVPFWVKDVLGREEGAVTTLMGPFLLMNLLFVFVFNRLAMRWGKRQMFLAALLGTALVLPLLSLVGRLPFGTPMLQSALVMGLIGVPVAGFLMLPFALLADVVDHDESLTGQRREAIYFGVQAIGQKAMIGLSIVVFGWLAYLGGEGKTTELGLEAVAWLAAFSALLAFLAFRGYRLSARTNEAIP